MRLIFLTVLGFLLGTVAGAPAQSQSGLTIENLLTRNRVRNGDLDGQTQNDLRILRFFETELNKIFSCYIRLSCPKTRSPAVISECEEIKDWPLYHQVMRMAGIKRYPYSRALEDASRSRGTRRLSRQ